MTRCRVNSETVSTTAARRTVIPTVARMRQTIPVGRSPGMSMYERSWIVTTTGTGHSGGATYWTWSSDSRSRLARAGSSSASRR